MPNPGESKSANPPELEVSATEYESKVPSELTEATPQPTGASAEKLLSGVAKAGVTLSYFVLSILSVSILLLLGSLVWLSHDVSDDVMDTYARAMNSPPIGSELIMLGRLESVARDYKLALSDKDWKMPEVSVEDRNELFSILAALPSVSNSQKSILESCRPLPEGEARTTILEKCITVLNDIRQSALEAASSISNFRIVGDAGEKLLAHRQALLTFWLQAAQLILLNLLLPLLTALFGYIFGTQQAEQARPSN